MIYVPEKFIANFRKYVPYSFNAGTYLQPNPVLMRSSHRERAIRIGRKARTHERDEYQILNREDSVISLCAIWRRHCSAGSGC